MVPDLKLMEWYNVELPKEQAMNFREFLVKNSIQFEPSAAGEVVHFECFVSDAEVKEVNAWLEEHMRES